MSRQQSAGNMACGSVVFWLNQCRMVILDNCVYSCYIKSPHKSSRLLAGTASHSRLNGFFCYMQYINFACNVNRIIMILSFCEHAFFDKF